MWAAFGGPTLQSRPLNDTLHSCVPLKSRTCASFVTHEHVHHIEAYARTHPERCSTTILLHFHPPPFSARSHHYQLHTALTASSNSLPLQIRNVPIPGSPISMLLRPDPPSSSSVFVLYQLCSAPTPSCANSIISHRCFAPNLCTCISMLLLLHFLPPPFCCNYNLLQVRSVQTPCGPHH